MEEAGNTSPASKPKIKKSKRSSKTKKKSHRAQRSPLFPACAFEEALTIANAIQKHASGQKVRRLTLFDQIGKSPDSGPSRQLIINSNKYGLTRGGYQGEFIELTPEGNLSTAPDVSPREKLRGRFQLAISSIESFKAFYDKLVGNRLPANSVLEDMAKDISVPETAVKEFIEIFIVNAKFLGILKTIAGAERIIPIEQALEELPEGTSTNTLDPIAKSANVLDQKRRYAESGTSRNWEKTCFYITPIGEEGTENRKHSDLFLGSIIEPALEEFGLEVIRADRIGVAGMITAQILEFILKAKLVIADLSYHNPNVFYELALRHVSRLPTVQIIRKIDKIPFDLEQFRTIQVDTLSIYTMIPNLQTYRAEIATQVRMALKDPDSVDNPISTFYPSLKISI
jgi:hypothetical protein